MCSSYIHLEISHSLVDLVVVLKCVLHAQQVSIVVSWGLGAFVRTESEKKRGVISLFLLLSDPVTISIDWRQRILTTQYLFNVCSKIWLFMMISFPRALKLLFKNCCWAYTEILDRVATYFDKPSNRKCLIKVLRLGLG